MQYPAISVFTCMIVNLNYKTDYIYSVTFYPTYLSIADEEALKNQLRVFTEIVLECSSHFLVLTAQFPFYSSCISFIVVTVVQYIYIRLLMLIESATIHIFVLLSLCAVCFILM